MARTSMLDGFATAHHTRIPVRGAVSFMTHRRHGIFTRRIGEQLHPVKIPALRDASRITSAGSTGGVKMRIAEAMTALC